MQTERRAQELATELGRSNTVHGPFDLYKEYIDHATIVINTTSMGYGGEVIQLPAGNNRLFFDISYGKIAAPQIEHARMMGWRVRDGLSMLVAQAAYSFEIWFKEAPDQKAALRRCRTALEAVT